MVTLSKSFLDAIWIISYNCGNPNRVLATMKRAMEQTVKLQHTIYILDLHVKLKKIKVGTSTIEKLTTKLCNQLPEKRKETLKDLLLGWRITQARKNIRTEKYQNTKLWRQSKPIIEEENILHEYNMIWKEEKQRQYEYFKRAVKEKICFYRRKYKKAVEIPDDIDDIIICEQNIPREYTKTPKCYGNSQICESDKNVLYL